MRFFRRRRVEIPPPSDPVWRDIVTGRKILKAQHFGAIMLLINMKSAYNQHPTPTTLEKSITKLYLFFEKNKHNPLIRQDLKKLEKLRTMA